MVIGFVGAFLVVAGFVGRGGGALVCVVAVGGGLAADGTLKTLSLSADSFFGFFCWLIPAAVLSDSLSEVKAPVAEV